MLFAAAWAFRCFKVQDMKIALPITFCLLLAVSTGASAFCFKEAGARYGIDPLLLYAIAKQESKFNPKAVNRNNKDGTYDVSLMQINSSHFDELARFGITERDLLQNPCLATHVGAWILARNMQKYGNKTTSGFWSAVGAYNAGTSNRNHSKRMHYAWKIYNHMASIK